MCSARGHVEVLGFDTRRYVGAQIGIHGPSGEKVGAVSHLRNTEHVLVAGPRRTVRRMVEAAQAARPEPGAPAPRARPHRPAVAR